MKEVVQQSCIAFCCLCCLNSARYKGTVAQASRYEAATCRAGLHHYLLLLLKVLYTVAQSCLTAANCHAKQQCGMLSVLHGTVATFDRARRSLMYKHVAGGSRHSSALETVLWRLTSITSNPEDENLNLHHPGML